MEEGAEVVMDRDEEELVEPMVEDARVEPIEGGRTRVHEVSCGAERPTDKGDFHGLEAQGGAAGLRDQDGEGGLVNRGDNKGSEDVRG